MLEPVELIGYLASALVVTSLAMTSVVRLRVVSLVGSVTFVIYGLAIGAIPIVVTNASIAVINAWFLRRELGGRRDLGAVVVPRDSAFLVDFLDHHAAEIERFQPDWSPDVAADFALVVTRDGLPAGVLMGRREGEHLDIVLDYVLRAFRDSSLGRWLFGPGSKVFTDVGIQELAATARTETHGAYLERVGFSWEGNGRYRCVIGR